jgi:hypothetical protein
MIYRFSEGWFQMRRDAAAAAILMFGVVLVLLLVWFLMLGQRDLSRQDQDLKAKLLMNAPR